MKKWNEMSSRERDALVAEKVMGWVPEQVGMDFGRPLIEWYEYRDDKTRYNVTYQVNRFNPSTELTSAWQVIEKMRIQNRYFDVRAFASGYQVSTGSVSVLRQEAADAICLVALLVMGVEIQYA